MDEQYLVECCDCRKKYVVSPKYYNERRKIRGRCRSCSAKGKNNPNYGISKKIHTRDKVDLTCNDCGATFEITYKRATMRREKYGVDLCISCSRKGERNPFFGLRFSDDKKKELGQIRKDFYNDPALGELRRELQRQLYLGENNPMWKGSTEKSDYTWRSKTWRSYILKLFNNTCDICKKHFDEEELIAHHLNGANWDIENRLNLENGVCLCGSCLKAFHSKYGYGDNTKEQYDEFVKEEGSETTEGISFLI